IANRPLLGGASAAEKAGGSGSARRKGSTKEFRCNPRTGPDRGYGSGTDGGMEDRGKSGSVPEFPTAPTPVM
ncbi:MAG TPA: hypothetical protein VFW15_15620, partial [Thermoanaerobaculia bacterium]|nr:hypothetical protein [Thermoanaerobaculia bacterium]